MAAIAAGGLDMPGWCLLAMGLAVWCLGAWGWFEEVGELLKRPGPPDDDQGGGDPGRVGLGWGAESGNLSLFLSAMQCIIL